MVGLAQFSKRRDDGAMRIARVVAVTAVSIVTLAGASASPAKPLFPARLTASSLTPTQQATQATLSRAFVDYLHATYPGGLLYYGICPPSDQYEGTQACEAELLVSGAWRRLAATATLSGEAYAFAEFFDHAWRRQWTPYAHRYTTGPYENGHGFHVPGVASTNGAPYDWGWIVAGAYYVGWKEHRGTFTVYGMDGRGTPGLGHFYQFYCRTRRGLVTCTNALGDSIRYRPRS